MELLAVFLVLLLVFGVVIYSSLAWGIVLYKFWAWFVLPVFVGLPQLSFWAAVGLMLVIGLFRNQSDQWIKDEYTDKGTTVFIVFIGPWLTLFVGWLIRSLFIF